MQHMDRIVPYRGYDNSYSGLLKQYVVIPAAGSSSMEAIQMLAR
ncbi:hypothetical protein BMS3Bbin04_01272 [bacterium BMS3Bbin04]|nr:hypothetical protein BMS3Bbin04_01272 [bacterium BMS3Bbin04]